MGRLLRRIEVIGLGLAIALQGCVNAIATPEAIAQVEQVFTKYRPDLVSLAENAVAELEQSDGSDRKLPPRNFYDSAWVSRTLSGQSVVVNFVVEEFYLPLVYISTDEPEDAYDTCANGGRVVKRLEPHWYICQRDWN